MGHSTISCLGTHSVNYPITLVNLVIGISYQRSLLSQAGHGADPAEVENEALRLLDEHLQCYGKSLLNYPGLPIPPPRAAVVGRPHRLIQEQLAFDHQVLAADLAVGVPSLNADQRGIFDAVRAAVDGGAAYRGKARICLGLSD